MKRSVLLEMRCVAKQELLAYRKNQARLAARECRAEERESIEKWAAAIVSARRLLKREAPEKERAMTRLFGLDTPIPRFQKAYARVLKLCMDLNVSEATLYKWREDIILLVLGAAIEAGAVRPFGINAPHD